MYIYTFSDCHEGAGKPNLSNKNFEELVKEILQKDLESCIHIYEVDCENAKIIKEQHYYLHEFLNKFAPKGYTYETLLLMNKLENSKWKLTEKVENYDEAGVKWEDVIYCYEKK